MQQLPELRKSSTVLEKDLPLYLEGENDSSGFFFPQKVQCLLFLLRKIIPCLNMQEHKYQLITFFFFHFHGEKEEICLVLFLL